MNQCTFCQLIKGGRAKEDTIYEDDRVLVLLDIDWAVKGHTLIIWKEHIENASSLSETDFLYFSKIFRRAEKALLEILKVDRSVVLRTGWTIPHFHFHIYPVKREVNPAEILDMMHKRVRHEPASGEKEELVKALRNRIFVGRKFS